MVEWVDDAIVLSARKQGETSLILNALTATQGKQSGLVRGGARSRERGAVEPGAEVIARWKARLPEHLGQLAVELKTQHAGHLLDDPGRLAALASALALVEASLPEREPHARLYGALLGFVRSLSQDADWGRRYLAWELSLLQDLGFGLDLGSCAVTGATENLRYVSPRTGRAVSGDAGAAYADRLLPLPGYLVGREPGAGDVAAGAVLTSHFIDRHLFEGRAPPAARARLIARLVPDSFALPTRIG